MANIIIVLILVALVGYGIYSYVHHLTHGGGCCGERDAAAKKVKVEDHNKAHYPHTHVPGTWAAVDLAAQNVTILTKDEADEDAIRQAIRDAGYLPLRTTSKV